MWCCGKREWSRDGCFYQAGSGDYPLQHVGLGGGGGGSWQIRVVKAMEIRGKGGWCVVWDIRVWEMRQPAPPQFPGPICGGARADSHEPMLSVHALTGVQRPRVQLQGTIKPIVGEASCPGPRAQGVLLRAGRGLLHGCVHRMAGFAVGGALRSVGQKGDLHAMAAVDVS